MKRIFSLLPAVLIALLLTAAIAGAHHSFTMFDRTIEKVVTGKVVRLTDFGAFVELEAGVDGLLHVSQMSHRPVNRPEDLVSVGDELTLLVIRVDPNERRIGLSLKELAHAVAEAPPVDTGGGGAGRGRGKRGTSREYDYDDEE